MYLSLSIYFFFFFKQKTAYEMRISDWSSDVCSSDLCAIAAAMTALAHGGSALAQVAGTGEFAIGSGTISPPGPLGPGAPPNSTQVTVNGAQTVINWTPDDTAPSRGPIGFLPTRSHLVFSGPGDSTVLTRLIAPADAAR